MPYGKRKKFGKKFPRKRKMYRRRRTFIPRVPNTKSQQLVKMKYCEGFSLNPGTFGTLATHAWRANSIEDPNHTGTGHQPFGHDQWYSFYNHYVVLGSRITVTCTNVDENTNPPVIVGIFVSDDTTYSTTGVTSLMEQNRSRYRLINNSYSGKVKLTQNFSAKKFFNVKDVKDNLTRIGAPMGNNPTEEAYFVVYCGNALDNGIDCVGVNCMATIEYLVAFSEPKEIAQS